MEWHSDIHAGVGTRRALGNARACGFVKVYTTDYLTVVLHTNFTPTSICAWRCMGSPPVSSCVGHLRVLRVRLLSIDYYELRPVQWVGTQHEEEHRRASRRGQLAGTRYARLQANRGKGLGRGDPLADGASGLHLQAGTYVQDIATRSAHRVPTWYV